MNKALQVLGLLVLLVAVVAVLSLPKQMMIQIAVPIKAHYNVVHRSLLNNNILAKNDYNKKLLAEVQSKNLLTENNVRYTVFSGHTNGINITIKKDALSLNSKLKIVPVLQDSMLVIWNVELPQTTNAFKKVARFFQSREIKADMVKQLNYLKQFTEDDNNIYGLTIQRKKMKYNFIITTRTTVNEYPKTTLIYYYINKLQNYIKQHQAIEEDAPMLHIGAIDNHKFEMIVAIPINKKLPDNKIYVTKQMMPGYVLEAKVKGGNHEIKNAFLSIENYMEDYGLSTPAIPFELLETNRVKEKNDSNWLTTIYYPVY